MARPLEGSVPKTTSTFLVNGLAEINLKRVCTVVPGLEMSNAEIRAMITSAERAVAGKGKEEIAGGHGATEPGYQRVFHVAPHHGIE